MSSVSGTEQIRMTLDTYSHVLPSMQQEAMKKLDSIFGVDTQQDNKQV